MNDGNFLNAVFMKIAFAEVVDLEESVQEDLDTGIRDPNHGILFCVEGAFVGKSHYIHDVRIL